MIRRMLGALLGGTTCGRQYGFDWLASRLITPPNVGGGGGRYFPSMVVVAPGEPGVPVVCCAGAGAPSASSKEAATSPHGASRRVSSRCLSIMGSLPMIVALVENPIWGRGWTTLSLGAMTMSERGSRAERLR